MAEIIDIHVLMERQAENVTKLEFEARKEYLEGYTSIIHRLEENRMELEELEYDIGPGSCCGNGMPGSGQVSDGSGRIINRMAKKDSLKAVIRKEESALIRRRDEISCAIDSMINGKQQEVLHYLYIRGIDVDGVAEKMHYSPKQVRRIRDKALKAIKLPRREIARIKTELIKMHPEWADIAA